MHKVVILLLAFVSAPSLVNAQVNTSRPEIKSVHIGFRAYHRDGETCYKVGLWTPVYVTIFGGDEGLSAKNGVEIEAIDSEDVGTRIRFPVEVKPHETVTVIGYVKTGRGGRGTN